MRILQMCIVQLITITVKCDHRDDVKSKNPLPFFRRQEEIQSEDFHIEYPNSDDSQSNLVSVLVNNVKDIFSIDATDLYEPPITTVTPETVKSTLVFNNKTTEEDPKLTDDVMGYQNMSLSTLIDINFNEPVSITDDLKVTVKNAPMLPKEMKSFEESELKLQDTFTSISLQVKNSNEVPGTNKNNTSGRSCIFCDNVKSENCNDPQNKLISSVRCDREGDLCYSQHTPFGIIDRGCFNVNHNLTTYVCSCNLCNYISISEMPYIFSNKRDWVDNVVEISRTRNLRKSVHKDMACLRCEFNGSSMMKEDLFDRAHCFEGSIGSVPTQICEENEVCAVKSIRSEGYVWRGCVSSPLYNYWWSLCDEDLCNYDALVSIYDFV